MIRNCFILTILLIILLISCKKDKPLSSEKSITSFVLKTTDNNLSSDITGTISNDTIYVKLPSFANLHQLVPTISFTGKNITPQDSTAQDFSSPFHYVVTAENGSIRTYTVIVNYLSSVKKITSFIFTAAANPGLPADIEATISGDTITAIVPLGLNIYKLVPAITYSGKSISPLNNEEFNFSLSAIYTVMAEDSTTKSYTVLLSSNKSVFINSGNYLYALNAANGTVKWRFNMNYPVAAPAYHDGVVFAGASGENLYAINAANGTLKWVDKHRPGKHSICTVKNGMVYCSITAYGGWRYLYAVDEATGVLKWEYKFLYGSYNTLGNPAEADGMLYLTALAEGIYGFNAFTGELKWHTNDLGISMATPVVVNGEVYFGAESAVLAALDAGTGGLKWRAPISGSAVQASPTIQDGIIYTSGYETDNRKYVYAFDVTTHAETWKSPATYQAANAGEIFTSPYVYGNSIYIGNANTNTYRLNLHDGSVNWANKGSWQQHFKSRGCQ